VPLAPRAAGGAPALHAGAGVPDALCEELCRLGRYARAALFLGPAPDGRCRAAGSAGLGDAALERLVVPVGGRAPDRDRRRQIPQDIRAVLSDDCRAAADAGRLVVVPLSDGGRRVGFLLAQATDERRPGPARRPAGLGAFARAAAIALRSVPPAPGPQRPALAMAKQLHDTVVQRLAGLSLLLATDQELGTAGRERCREEVGAAIDELRAVLEHGTTAGAAGARPCAPARGAADELAALRSAHPAIRIASTGLDGPADDARGAALIDAFVAEALRNARKHARPREVQIERASDAATITLTVRNDGVAVATRGGCGMGLRLLETEAALAGGLVDAGLDASGWWRARLILPQVG
jgi:hypothetical protein